MLKSLLIGLDGSPHSESAVELGLSWANRFGAELIGLGIVDEPGLYMTGKALLEGSHFWHTAPPTHEVYEARRRVDQILDRFTRRCHEAGVQSETVRTTGSPFVQILLEAQGSDLILLGQETHFNEGAEESADETLAKVLRDSPRPLVTVPKTMTWGKSIIVAYDGSLQAARTLQAFESSGLGGFQHVHVVSVDQNFQNAAQHANRAITFLRRHGIEATAHPIETSAPATEIILNNLRSFDAGLLVMGAYGQPVLREFFLGSVTCTLLRECPVPIFCTH